MFYPGLHCLLLYPSISYAVRLETASLLQEMAAKSGLPGVSYKFFYGCLYVRHIWCFLYSVQCQLGYRPELEMLFQGRSGHH